MRHCVVRLVERAGLGPAQAERVVRQVESALATGKLVTRGGLVNVPGWGVFVIREGKVVTFLDEEMTPVRKV